MTQMIIFLRMCNVYRRFFKIFAPRANTLSAMTRAEVSPDYPKPADLALAAVDDVRPAFLAPANLELQKAKD